MMFTLYYLPCKCMFTTTGTKQKDVHVFLYEKIYKSCAKVIHYLEIKILYLEFLYFGASIHSIYNFKIAIWAKLLKEKDTHEVYTCFFLPKCGNVLVIT